MSTGPHPFAQARFLLSAARLEQLPRDETAEVGFAGRSNAGKSSALNTLCGVRGLARTSKTPGRTQLLNLFELPTGGRMVDLPGYGFAQAPEAVRRGWGALVGGYIETRANLRGLVVLMDVRHPLKPLDTQMLDWARAHARPVHVLLTKADKLGRGAAGTTLVTVRKTLAGGDAGTTVQLFSATSGLGLDEARERIAAWL